MTTKRIVVDVNNVTDAVAADFPTTLRQLERTGFFSYAVQRKPSGEKPTYIPVSFTQFVPPGTVRLPVGQLEAPLRSAAPLPSSTRLRRSRDQSSQTTRA